MAHQIKCRGEGIGRTNGEVNPRAQNTSPVLQSRLEWSKSHNQLSFDNYFVVQVLEDMYNFRNFLNRKSVMERMQAERWVKAFGINKIYATII